MKNVPELRLICKERNLANAHLTKKQDIVKLLEENSLNSIHNELENIIEYNKFNSKELKNLAKTRKLTNYNNLKKDELVKLHKDYDDDIKMVIEDIDDDVVDIKMVDETNQNIISNKDTKNSLSKVFKFDNKELRTLGTYDESWFVAKDICNILDLKKIDSTIRNIPDKWKGTQVLSTLGGNQEMTH